MSEFDIQKLLKKIKKSKCKKSLKTYKFDLLALKGLATLIEWCNKNNLDVIFSNKEKIGRIYFETKEIFINSNYSIQRKLFVLLHEIGHFLIYKNSFQKYPSFPGKKVVDRINEIEEEYEAWNRGLRLIKKFNIKINKKQYEIYRAHCLMLYCRVYSK